jgi:hypothetical protein
VVLDLFQTSECFLPLTAFAEQMEAEGSQALIKSPENLVKI